MLALQPHRTINVTPCVVVACTICWPFSEFQQGFSLRLHVIIDNSGYDTLRSLSLFKFKVDLYSRYVPIREFEVHLYYQEVRGTSSKVSCIHHSECEKKSRVIDTSDLQR